MKSLLLFNTLCIIALSLQIANGQGFENFNNYIGTSGHYHNGSFIGQDGSMWTYKQCRNDRPIISPSPCLGKARDTLARICSGTIHNGCGTLSFDYKQGYSTAVNLDVYVNNIKVCNVISPGGSGDTSIVHTSGPVSVNLPGDFFFEFIQSDSTGSGQVTIDNIEWTCDTAFPEPSDYPTNFTAIPGYFKVSITWTDATGTQIPTSYLLLAGASDDFQVPVDGQPVPDDPDLGDGYAILNVLPGVQSALFTGLQMNTTYYFVIYPYTNSGALINYKTDGTPPTVNATTTNGTIIFYHNFNDFQLSPMVPVSGHGPTQAWKIDSAHGTSSSPCARISRSAQGDSVTSGIWLITPPLNFDLYSNELFSFMNAFNTPGDLLAVKISNDYDGKGDPDDFTWSSLSPLWSPGDQIWTFSGDMDVSGTVGDSVYIGFIYTSDTGNISTWKIDDILITGTSNVGTGNLNYTSDYKLFPNPSHGQVRILFKDADEREIRIINLTGNTIYSEVTSLSDRDLDFSNLPPGIYIVKIIEISTSKERVSKLIIL
jgi:hypothetical protein